MRWATYRSVIADEDRVGLLVEERVFGLRQPTSLRSLLGDDGEMLARAAEDAVRDPAEVLDIAQVRLRSPIPEPPAVRDFYAFEQHVRRARQGRGLDIDPDWYQIPVFYFSNPQAMVGDGDDVAVPPGCAELDFELEVAAVVGRGGSDLTPDAAESHIAGFCVMNDWSARDLQRREMKQSLGPAKGKDFATSLGPVLVTADELATRSSGRAYDLTMTAQVNGREYSRANLGDIYWSFGEMLAYASRGTRIVPGDVIGSGTCGSGCILELSLVHGSDAFPWLQPGDEVTLSVDGLGSLRNRIVPGPALRPLRTG
jgi:2-keto-4-pentenoate hydratase/2-oxohepta-3-ene-1,7-dioic acid hydratase in catechol pathway